MTRETVEQMLDLNVIFAQTESGATDDSKAIFEAYHDQVGAPKIVVLAYVTEPGWEFLTYVVGEGNLVIGIVSWGYGSGVAMAQLAAIIGFGACIISSMSFLARRIKSPMSETDQTEAKVLNVFTEAVVYSFWAFTIAGLISTIIKIVH